MSPSAARLKLDHHCEQEGWQAWLRLMQTPGVGLDTARRLLSLFGLPEQIFGAEYAELKMHVSERIALNLSNPVSSEIQAQIELTQTWLEQTGNHLVSLADAAYPQSLLEIADPPILLYVKGRLELLNAPTIAVVGSRNASAQGLINAEKFSEHLSLAGLAISSGLAAGIDAAAHQGALRGLGSTIAVIGTGADIVYPARNRQLAHHIAQSACIVSEYALGTPAIAGNFPRRNRIISGLAKGVLVVEAAAQSGSLITARMAAEQGREVFAIPGSIHSPLAKGCHQLIKQGAKLAESAQDILDEIQFPLFDNQRKNAAPVELVETVECQKFNKLLAIIGYDPVHIDVLMSRGNTSIDELSAHLLELELVGALVTLPGGMIQRLT